MNFLKLRFPAFLGMNVLYSLGLFGWFIIMHSAVAVKTLLFEC